MAKGMAKVQDSAQATFGFVLPDDLGLNLATTGDELSERALIFAKQLRHLLLNPIEKRSIINDAVFDYLRETGAIFLAGKVRSVSRSHSTRRG